MYHSKSIFSLGLLCSLGIFLISCDQTAQAQKQTDLTNTSKDSLIQSAMPQSTPFDTVDIKYLLGQFNPSEEADFVQMSDAYTAGNARGKYLHKEAYEAFKKMQAAAKADGISLVIRSATRNFYYQKGIWERKWTGARRVEGKNLAQTVADPGERARIILRYSSMPGTSRHHWGTDIDLNAFENSYFESGQGLLEFQWLEKHAAKFGFARPYTAKGEDRPNGYEEEKWHWSYLPLAKNYQDSYRALVKAEMIKGFKGAEAAIPIDVISNYVFGISPACFK